MKTSATGWLIMAVLLAAPPLEAQMANPDIDQPGESFSWPACSTDQIALQNAASGTEITPEGYLYTGYGEMTFSIGNPSQPAYQRIRTLDSGYLPIVHYSYSEGSIRYRLTAFTGSYPAESGSSRPLNFVRVIATNVGSKKRTGFFSVAFPYTGGAPGHGICSQVSHRFRRPVKPARPGDYSQPGAEFNPNWVYALSPDGLATRSGKVVYQFPVAPRPLLAPTPETSGEAAPGKISPTTPVLMARYQLELAPGGERTLIFKMPVEPVPAGDAAAVRNLKSANFDRELAATRRFWQNELDKGIEISLPEKEVTDAFKANLIDDMMAREHTGGDYIQTVNVLQYHAFWLRDGSQIMNAYDVAGYPRLVRQSLPFFLSLQKPNGLFISQSGQYDGWGQALWALGRYYELYHDTASARRSFPAVVKAVQWLEAARQSDPLGIMPAGNPNDDEFHVLAHVTGHNFWALAGLQEAIVLAKAVGTEDQVRQFQQDYSNYHHVLFSLLGRIGARNGNYIPPGIEISGGQDWGNMNVLYPEMLVSPTDPLVKGTLNHVRKEYAEGLMTYAGRLHDYIGFKNTETELILEEQRQVIEDLYAELVHTSSTRAGWEVGPYPWTTRDFGNDLAPHGWFSADYVALIRNMLVREQDGGLELLSALSPDWTRPGDTITVSNAPTEFGRIGFRCRFTPGGMKMTLQPAFNRRPGKIVVHLPWFVIASGAVVDDNPVEINDGTVSVPSTARTLDVEWTPRTPAPNLSYNSAVEAYKAEYLEHYQSFLKYGMPATKRPRLY